MDGKIKEVKGEIHKMQPEDSIKEKFDELRKELNRPLTTEEQMNRDFVVSRMRSDSDKHRNDRFTI